MCQASPAREAVAKTCSSVANTCSLFLLQRTCVEPNTAILFYLPILPIPGLVVRLSIFYKLAHQLGTPYNYSTEKMWVYLIFGTNIYFQNTHWPHVLTTLLILGFRYPIE